jgi:clan AA aspartic protease
VIQGTVNGNLETTLSLIVQDAKRHWVTIDAVVDSGFNAFLTLSSADVQGLGLPFERQELGLLADGSTCLFDVHTATVDWDGQTVAVPALVAEGAPLVGMSMLHGFKLTIEVKPGGAVTIESLP